MLKMHRVRLMIIVLATFMAVTRCEAQAGQPSGRITELRSQVLNLAYATDADVKPHFVKLVMRFGDSDMQLSAVVYPGGKGELVRTRLVNMGGERLADRIVKQLRENPRITAKEIADSLSTEVSRVAIDYDQHLSPALDELRAIRISPVLLSRIVVDSDTYEFWYDTWQEAVHYTLAGSFESPGAQNELGRWMLMFRARAEEWLKDAK